MWISAKYHREQGKYLECLGICFGIRSDNFYARDIKTPGELVRQVRLAAAHLYRSEMQRARECAARRVA